MKVWKFPVMVSLLILTLLACSSKKEAAINFGQYDEGVYTNSYFNIRVPLPEAWYVMDDESRIAMMKKGAQVVSGDNQNLKALLDASDMQSMNLLTAYANPPGAAVSSNPSIIVIAEKIDHMPGIKRGSDYHFHTKKLMEQSALNVTFPTEIYESSIGGVGFDVMDIDYNLPKGSNFQRQYCTTIKNYALLVIITFQDDDGQSRLENILAGIEFGPV